MDKQLSKEEQAVVETATQELQEVCAKHGVEVIAYIHALGPRIQVVKVPDAESQNGETGQDENSGERVSPSDEQPSRSKSKTLPNN